MRRFRTEQGWGVDALAHASSDTNAQAAELYRPRVSSATTSKHISDDGVSLGYAIICFLCFATSLPAPHTRLPSTRSGDGRVSLQKRAGRCIIACKKLQLQLCHRLGLLTLGHASAARWARPARRFASGLCEKQLLWGAPDGRAGHCMGKQRSDPHQYLRAPNRAQLQAKA